MTAATTKPTTSGVARRRRSRLTAVAVAVLAPSIVWLVATVAGADLVVDTGNGQPMTVGLPIVVAFSAQSAVLGWLTLALLERFTTRARLSWTVLAGLVLLLSFGPVVAAEADVETKIALSLMHLAVGGALIPFLPRREA